VPDQVGQREPHRQPGDGEQKQALSGDQHHHDQREREHAAEEPVDCGVAGHVPPGVAVDDAAEEGDRHPHHDG